MLEKILSSKNVIHKALDGTWKRNEAIADNIANVNTPGYKRKVVSFEDELSAAMNRSDFAGADTDKIQIKVTQDNNNLSMKADGNNVDVETEMADLAKNAIQYNALVRFAGYNNIINVIKETK